MRLLKIGILCLFAISFGAQADDTMPKTKAEVLAETIHGLQQGQEALNQSVAALKNRIEQLENRPNPQSQEGAVASLRSGLERIDQVVRGLGDRIQAIEEQNVPADLASIRENVSTLAAQITALNEQMTGLTKSQSKPVRAHVARPKAQQPSILATHQHSGYVAGARLQSSPLPTKLADLGMRPPQGQQVRFVGPASPLR